MNAETERLKEKLREYAGTVIGACMTCNARIFLEFEEGDLPIPKLKPTCDCVTASGVERSR